MIDNTFKVAPNLFTHLHTIHGLLPDSYRLPLAYDLLSGKQQGMYADLLNELDTNGSFQPETVLADFEMELRSAISSTWPNAAIQGCYFHFMQSQYPTIWSFLDALKLEQGFTDQKIATASYFILLPPDRRSRLHLTLSYRSSLTL